MYLPVSEATTYDFEICPAAFLRTAADVELLQIRLGRRPWAEHLLDGVHHPAVRVSEMAAEIESGARNAETLTPKMRDAVHLWLTEQAKRREHDAELRRKREH